MVDFRIEWEIGQAKSGEQIFCQFAQAKSDKNKNPKKLPWQNPTRAKNRKI